MLGTIYQLRDQCSWVSSERNGSHEALISDGLYGNKSFMREPVILELINYQGIQELVTGVPVQRTAAELHGFIQDRRRRDSVHTSTAFKLSKVYTTLLLGVGPVCGEIFATKSSKYTRHGKASSQPHIVCRCAHGPASNLGLVASCHPSSSSTCCRHLHGCDTGVAEQ